MTQRPHIHKAMIPPVSSLSVVIPLCRKDPGQTFLAPCKPQLAGRNSAVPSQGANPAEQHRANPRSRRSRCQSCPCSSVAAAAVRAAAVRICRRATCGHVMGVWVISKLAQHQNGCHPAPGKLRPALAQCCWGPVEERNADRPEAQAQ